MPLEQLSRIRCKDSFLADFSSAWNRLNPAKYEVFFYLKSKGNKAFSPYWGIFGLFTLPR